MFFTGSMFDITLAKSPSRNAIIIQPTNIITIPGPLGVVHEHGLAVHRREGPDDRARVLGPDAVAPRVLVREVGIGTVLVGAEPS